MVSSRGGGVVGPAKHATKEWCASAPFTYVVRRARDRDRGCERAQHLKARLLGRGRRLVSGDCCSERPRTVHETRLRSDARFRCSRNGAPADRLSRAANALPVPVGWPE